MKVCGMVCKHEDVKDRNDNKATTNETKEMNICYFKAARVKVKTPWLLILFAILHAREITIGNATHSATYEAFSDPSKPYSSCHVD